MAIDTKRLVITSLLYKLIFKIMVHTLFTASSTTRIMKRSGILFILLFFNMQIFSQVRKSTDIIDSCCTLVKSAKLFQFRDLYPQVFYYVISRQDPNYKSFHNAIQNKDLKSAYRYLDSIANNEATWADFIASEDAKSIEGSKKFQTLNNRYKKRMDGKMGDLRKNLWQMMRTDQGIRFLYMELTNNNANDFIVKAVRHEMIRIDSINTSAVKKILDNNDWPDKNIVGNDAEQAMWLLVQHADHDPYVAVKGLSMLMAAVDKGGADKWQFAYLVDRIRMHEHRPQIYGTQTISKKDINGNRIYPIPIEDPENLDSRRTSMGLESMKKYMESFGAGNTWSFEWYILNRATCKALYEKRYKQQNI